VGDMIGGVHHLFRPLMDALQRYVFAASKLHADDTPIDVLGISRHRDRSFHQSVTAISSKRDR